MNSAFLRRSVAVVLIAIALVVSAQAGTASAAAIVIHPDEFACIFEPGDVPGVDISFPAQCTVVITPSGNATVVARGQLPAGYSLSETFVGTAPCAGVPAAARIVATTSGEVTAICHL